MHHSLMAVSRLPLSILFLALAACTSTPEPAVEKGIILKQSYHFVAAERKEQEYALYVPTGYDHHKGAPLLVLLHGLTSNPQQIMGYEGITEQAEKYGMIVVAPYGYNEFGWYGSLGRGKDFGNERLNQFTKDSPDNLGELSEQDVLNVLAIVRDTFNIDDDRIYLGGHSMGGGGTLYLGMKYADTWAALAPMAPAIFSNPDTMEKIKSTPIIVVQGDADDLVPVDNTRRWVAKMEALSMTHQYIEIAGGDHVKSITENSDMIATVFDFIAQQEK